MAEIRKSSFILFADFMAAVLALADEQAGKLFKLIFLYVNGMDSPKPEDPAVAAMFEMFRVQIDRENERWTEKCRRNTEASHKRRCYTTAKSKSEKGHPPISDDILNDNDNVNDSENDSEGLETVVSMKPITDERYSFDAIWNLYGKPVGDMKTIREKWEQLPDTDKAAVFDYVPKYVASRPDVKYRKNFDNFLSLRVWENEPLANHNYGNQQNNGSDTARRMSAVHNSTELLQEFLGGDR